MATINVSDFLGGKFVGYVGSQGVIGYTGSRGFTGSQGIIGYTGSRGYTGSQGVIGYTGSRAYTGSRGFAGSQGFTGTITETSELPPLNPIDGQMWFDTTNATIKVYYDDGNTSQWIDVSGPMGPTGEVGYSGSRGFIGSFGYTGSRGFVGSKGSFADWIFLNASNNNYQSQNLQAIIADTSSGSFTINLPLNPEVGFVVVFADGNNWGLNPLTIGRNGSTIEGVSSNFILNTSNSRYEFIYNGTTWKLVANKGDIGYSGSLGYTGSIGFTGSRGIQGFKADVSENQPNNIDTGHMWFDPSDGTLSVYYNDGDSTQWVVTSGPQGPLGEVGFTGSRGTIGFTGSFGYTGSKGINGILADTSLTPVNPINGQLWFDPVDATLSVYYSDGDSDQWVVVSGKQGPQGIPGDYITQTQKTTLTSLTPSIGDNGKMFIFNTINTATLTIPTNLNTQFDIGTTFHVMQFNTGLVQISGQSGVTIYRKGGTNARTSGQYSVVYLTKIDTNEWVLRGELG